ncbi:unnamed protein product [Amaranthus hypochondriacus]
MVLQVSLPAAACASSCRLHLQFVVLILQYGNNAADSIQMLMTCASDLRFLVLLCLC